MRSTRQIKETFKDNQKQHGVRKQSSKNKNMLRPSRQVLANVGSSLKSKYFSDQAKLTENGSPEKGTTDHCRSSGLPVNRYTVATPVGDYELFACARGVHCLQHISVRVDEQDLQPDLSTKVELKDEGRGKTGEKAAHEMVAWLAAYFAGDVQKARMPEVCHLNDVSDTSLFIPKVWKTLLTKVRFGDRVSYKELAVLAGYQSTSARAVGTAMRTNPVSILVPCHRVVKSDGSLGNYSSGYKNGLKQWLLEHESKM